MEEELRELGLDVADSQANFCWVALGEHDESRGGRGAHARRRRGAARAAALGGAGHLRVTYGTRAENERFIEAMRGAVSASG